MRRIRNLKTRGGGGVHKISKDDSLRDAAFKFIEANVDALVVCHDERVEGIFTKNDLVRCCAQHPGEISELTIKNHMTSTPFTASIDDNLDDVVTAMMEKGYHHVPIIENDRAVGMITPLDIIEHQKTLCDCENIELIKYIRGS